MWQRWVMVTRNNALWQMEVVARDSVMMDDRDRVLRIIRIPLPFIGWWVTCDVTVCYASWVEVMGAIDGME